jgi:hypothetical protein
MPQRDVPKSWKLFLQAGKRAGWVCFPTEDQKEGEKRTKRRERREIIRGGGGEKGRKRRTKGRRRKIT